jgi:hypothetical protein
MRCEEACCSLSYQELSNWRMCESCGEVKPTSIFSEKEPHRCALCRCEQINRERREQDPLLAPIDAEDYLVAHAAQFQPGRSPLDTLCFKEAMQALYALHAMNLQYLHERAIRYQQEKRDVREEWAATFSLLKGLESE